MEEDIKLIDGFFNKGWCCDLDEVYNTVMKIVEENELAKETIKNHCADMDKMNQKLYELKTENENITRELLARTDKLNNLLEERKQLKDKMIGDKMEQFDDYIIYLIESYLKILEE